MASSLPRYSRTPVLGLGSQYGTSYAIPVLRDQVSQGNIRVERLVLVEGERLDILAGRYYGDGRLWWVIAAASNVGWGLQCPPGTQILLPNLEDVSKYVG